MHLSPTLLLHLLLAPLTRAAHLRLSIPATSILPNPATLPPTTTATLTTLSQAYTAPLRLDNSFDFRNVSTGSYLLDVHCATHAFAPLRVDVHDGIRLSGKGNAEGVEKVAKVEVWGTFRGNEWANRGEVVAVTEVKADGMDAAGDVTGIWAFEGRVVGGKEYFMERSGFSPVSLLKNPMILIAGVCMVFVFGMPYIMENMDPELKAEFEERQKGTAIAGSQAANPLQNFDAAAWLAGSKKSESATRSTEERGVTR